MDRLMIEYLRNKSREGMSDHDFMHKFKEFLADHKRNSMRRDSLKYGSKDEFMPMNRMEDFYMKRHGGNDDFLDMFDSEDRFFNKHDLEDEDIHKMMRYMRNSMSEDHFTESEAKYLVADMYHTEGGRKHSGEKFDMRKAKEVCERYRGIFPVSVTAADVYVAINAQYHDYIELFKNWFNDNVDQKIIESAIVFWFRDVDSTSKNKIMDYFRGH